MPEFAKILLAEAEEGGAVNLGVTADPVSRSGMEVLSLLVLPDLGGVVAVIKEDFLRAPVLLLAGKEGSPLQYQDAFAGMGQTVGNGSPAGTGADNDEVVVLAHGRLMKSVLTYLTVRGSCEAVLHRRQRSTP